MSLSYDGIPKNWSIATFLPADGWYFVHTTKDGAKILHRVVLWGVEKDGNTVYGFMSLRSEPDKQAPPSLVPVPLVSGCYVHQDDLSSREQEALSRIRQGKD